jgi:urease accessory protein
MLEIKAKLKIPRAAYKVDVKGRLVLAFSERAKGGLRTRLESGEEVALDLPRGEVLRGGDLVTASDGRVIEVLSRTEQLLDIRCADAAELAKMAYQLGSRHVPVQVGEAFLRIVADPQLADMVKKLGAKVSVVEAPFEPEAVAERGKHADRGHVHDEHCGHDHHGHEHHHYESK